MTTLLIAAFFLVLGYLVIIDGIAPYILWFYTGVSVWTFIVYAWDKRQAIKGRWRVPEKTLHLWSLLGGWPGALMAQQKIRHKSSKKTFLWVYSLTVIINVSVLVWFLQSETGALIRSWFNR